MEGPVGMSGFSLVSFVVVLVGVAVLQVRPLERVKLNDSNKHVILVSF